MPQIRRWVPIGIPFLFSLAAVVVLPINLRVAIGLIIVAVLWVLVLFLGSDFVTARTKTWTIVIIIREWLQGYKDVNVHYVKHKSRVTIEVSLRSQHPSGADVTIHNCELLLRRAIVPWTSRIPWNGTAVVVVPFANEQRFEMDFDLPQRLLGKDYVGRIRVSFRNKSWTSEAFPVSLRDPFSRL